MTDVRSLKAWRKQYGLTQSAAASYLGVSLRTYCSYEAGYSVPEPCRNLIAFYERVNTPFQDVRRAVKILQLIRQYSSIHVASPPDVQQSELIHFSTLCNDGLRPLEGLKWFKGAASLD